MVRKCTVANFKGSFFTETQENKQNQENRLE